MLNNNYAQHDLNTNAIHIPSVIFYGAGDHAVRNLRRFFEKAGKPVCFVDADTRKHYTRLNYGDGEGYDILPLNVAIEKYPNHELWLTQARVNLFAITEFLIEQGIDRHRIQYFEDMEYRLGCRNLGKFIVANPKGIKSCCYPMSKRIYYDEEVFLPLSLSVYVERLKLWLDDTLQRLKAGESTDCDGCPELKMGLWDKKPEIERMTVGGGFEGVSCNCRCIYCSQKDTTLAQKGLQAVNIYDIFFSLSAILGESIKRVDLAEGEITVLPYRDKLLDLIIEKGWYAQIHTNSILYNEKVAEILRLPYSYLNVSLDCGTPETYRRVKGVDAFHKVVNNLKKYVSNGAKLTLKYFLLQGFNDNHEDIDGFVEIAKHVGVSRIDLTRDLNDIRNLTDTEFASLTRLISRAEERNLNIDYVPVYFTKTDRDKLDSLIKR